MSLTALRARAVFPVIGPPIADGVVTFEGDTIVEVGQEPAGNAPVQDLGNVALLPGLVNVHTHLEFSDLRQPLGRAGMNFADWISLIVADRRRHNRRPPQAVAAGLEESLRHGVTTVGEIAKGPLSDYLNVSPRPRVLAFQEVIAFSRVRADSAAADVVRRLDEARAALPNDDSLQLGISPHAPYSVSNQLVGDVVTLAAKQNLLVAMHLAESKPEMQFLAEGAGTFRDFLVERSMWDDGSVPVGTRPLEYLQMLARAPRALIIHGNYLNDVEIQFLVDNRDRMTLVHCPRTHAYFQHPTFPLADLLQRGVRIALGTDGRASTPDLCLLSEMRLLTRTHADLSPSAILEMGTLSAADSLGWGEWLGALAPGRQADMVAVSIPESAGQCCEEQLAAVLGDKQAVQAVWVAGRGADPQPTLE